MARAVLGWGVDIADRGPSISRPGVARAAVLIGSAIVLALLCAVVWTWWDSRERRALLHLSTDLRAGVYTRSLANFRDLCAGSGVSAALDTECAAQARFLVEFPECDPACRALAQRHLPEPIK